MSYSVIPIDSFKKEAKRLVKKFPSLKNELDHLNTLLIQDPTTGKSLGNNTYKLRLAVKSKGKGKSGGARVITYLVTEEKEVYLLTIYDKSELDAVDDKVLKKIIKDIKTIT